MRSWGEDGRLRRLSGLSGVHGSVLVYLLLFREVVCKACGWMVEDMRCEETR